jgi:hypothetical protein
MQLRLELPQPTRAAKVEWLSAWAGRNNLDLGLSPRNIADRLGSVSFAELEEFALDLQRRSILSGPEPHATEVTQRVLKQWSARATSNG